MKLHWTPANPSSSSPETGLSEEVRTLLETLPQNMTDRIINMGEVLAEARALRDKVASLENAAETQKGTMPAGAIFELTEEDVTDPDSYHTIGWYVAVATITRDMWREFTEECWRKAAWTFKEEPDPMDWLEKTHEIMPEELLRRGWAIRIQVARMEVTALTDKWPVT